MVYVLRQDYITVLEVITTKTVAQKKRKNKQKPYFQKGEEAMVNLKIRDFYQKENYENNWYFLLGMFMCTFVLLPIGFALKLFDKIVRN
ncbi:hypothetical protein CN406_17610 [Bacillus cereus]|nr:hypothetical protein CN406_17610 [Bacillus cereus]